MYVRHARAAVNCVSTMHANTASTLHGCLCEESRGDVKAWRGGSDWLELCALKSRDDINNSRLSICGALLLQRFREGTLLSMMKTIRGPGLVVQRNAEANPSHRLHAI